MHGARATTVDPGIAKGSWSEIFRDGLGLYSALVIGGIAMHATQMLVIAIIMPTIVADIGGADYLHLGGDALHDRRDRRRRSSTGVVWARLGAAPRLRARRRRVRARHGGLRAGPGYRLADRGAGGAGLGRRARLGQRHGADHRPLRRQPAHPHHRDVARHLHRLPSERTDRRRHVRGDAMVARLVLDDGAADAGLCRAGLLQDPGPAQPRARPQPLRRSAVSPVGTLAAGVFCVAAADRCRGSDTASS